MLKSFFTWSFAMLVVVVPFVFESFGLGVETMSIEDDYNWKDLGGGTKMSGYIGPGGGGKLINHALQSEKHLDLSDVKEIQNHQYEVGSFGSQTIYDSVTFNQSGVKLIGQSAFSGQNFKEIEITFENSEARLGAYAFSNNNLEKVEIKPGYRFFVIDSAPFRSNPNLKEIIILGENEVYTSTEENNAIYETKRDITKLIQGTKSMSKNIRKDTKKIGSYAFEGMDVDEVEIPDSVTEIGGNAFRNNNLESVIIPDSVTKIGGNAFRNNNLKSVNIPGSVTEVGSGVFQDNNLESVIIPDSVTKIGGNAFRNNNLKSVNIPGSVTEVGSGVFQDNNLESVVIPDSVTKIGGNAFQNNNLESVIIPSSVKKIGVSLFNENSNLKEVFLLTDDVEFGTNLRGEGPFAGTPDDLVIYGIPETKVNIGSEEITIEEYADREEKIEFRPLLGEVTPNGTDGWEKETEVHIESFEEMIQIDDFSCFYQEVNQDRVEECSINNILTLKKSGEYQVTLEGGIKGKNAKYKTKVFLLDNQEPYFEELEDKKFKILDEDKKIIYKIKDDHSGLKRVDYTLKNRKGDEGVILESESFDNEVEDGTGPRSKELIIELPTEIEVGEYELTITATDLAGNEKEANIKISVEGEFKLEIGDNKDVLDFGELELNGLAQKSVCKDLTLRITNTISKNPSWSLGINYSGFDNDPGTRLFYKDLNESKEIIIDPGKNRVIKTSTTNNEVVEGGLWIEIPKNTRKGEYYTEITITLTDKIGP